jgi:hypothetical protein
MLGLMANALNYVKDAGITSESAYPYTATKGRKCKVTSGAFKITGYKSI